LGIFPDRLKYAVVKPIFKKGDRSNITNYRPISMLSSFSKVFEKKYAQATPRSPE
jgi:Notch-like protein